MADRCNPSDAHEQLDGGETLTACWDRFRKGQPVVCARSGSPIALAVDASSASYRLVCTRCGVTSPWFESPPLTGLRIRTVAPPSTGFTGE